MTPEELEEIRSTLEFASQAGVKDEFMDTTFNLLEFIDEQAAQIEALKDNLVKERAKVLAWERVEHDAPHYSAMLLVARQQLKAEMPGVEWE